MKRAIIYGVWDLTHYGHYSKFRMLKDLGYEVVVGVVSDDFAESYKRRPVMSEEERFNNVQACKWVDEVFVSQGREYFQHEVERKDIQIIAHGSDWSDHEYQGHMDFAYDFMKDYKMVTLPYTKGVSTTEILKRIQDV